MTIEHRKVDWSWLQEVDFKDLLDKDPLLVYQHCGLQVLCALWTHLPSLHLYISEKSLFEIKKLYVRTYHNPRNEQYTTKAIAVRLGVSTKFVDEALSETDIKDERQEKLL